jgi:GTPase SAR1 family protein
LWGNLLFLNYYHKERELYYIESNFNFIYNIDGVILLFDLTNLNSFSFLKNGYFEKVKELKLNFLLAGTKEDYINNEVNIYIDEEYKEYKKNKNQINTFVNENKINYIEVSSITGKNVNESILKLIKLCYDKKVLI